MLSWHEIGPAAFVLAYFFQGVSLGLSGAAAPGPFQTYLIGQSLKMGWRRALPVAFAPLISDGPIITLILFVLTRFPAGFLRVIQVAGGFFVLYLAWKAFQTYRHFQPAEVNAETQGHKTLLQAVGVNFLSPGPYIFWSLLAGPVLIRGWNEMPARGLGFLFGFYLTMISGLALLVVLFGAARRLGPRFNRVLIGVSALALLGFGLYQLWQGLLGAG